MCSRKQIDLPNQAHYNQLAGSTPPPFKCADIIFYQVKNYKSKTIRD